MDQHLQTSHLSLCSTYIIYAELTTESLWMKDFYLIRMNWGLSKKAQLWFGSKSVACNEWTSLSNTVLQICLLLIGNNLDLNGVKQRLVLLFETQTMVCVWTVPLKQQEKAGGMFPNWEWGLGKNIAFSKTHTIFLHGGKTEKQREGCFCIGEHSNLWPCPPPSAFWSGTVQQQADCVNGGTRPMKRVFIKGGNQTWPIALWSYNWQCVGIENDVK